ncbi:hypothetical protein OG384_04670 [Streptomyces sp. NBC_01324]|uniref:hypothetical protein n=1 Tax=Streptomyces sp. NBC_01324 TaxID=2903826 RepID=UPI002E139CA6|nr:hypothetical protein OG384_04670 [Streptomyces sp. NBC_01324]
MNSRITSVTVHLDGTPDQVTLHDSKGLYPVLQIGSALTLHIDQTPTETLLAVAAALVEAAEARDTAADVADQVAAEDGVRHIGVPYQRNGSVAA